MTSGMGNSRDWILEYAPAEARRIDPLMGWTGSGDMKRQVQLRFETREAAIDYAERHGLLTALHHGLGWEDAGRLANACGAT